MKYFFFDLTRTNTESPKDVACRLMNFRDHLLLIARVIQHKLSSTVNTVIRRHGLIRVQNPDHEPDHSQQLTIPICRRLQRSFHRHPFSWVILFTKKHTETETDRQTDGRTRSHNPLGASHTTTKTTKWLNDEQNHPAFLGHYVPNECRQAKDDNVSDHDEDEDNVGS